MKKFVAVAALALLAAPPSARAQSDLQITPNGRRTLISKDVGAERWAIALDAETGGVTGNVYRTDGGDPQFVWCREMDRGNGEVRLRCKGTQSCEPWAELGEVRLPVSFVEPDAQCPAGSVATTSTGRAQAGASGEGASSALRLSPDGRSVLINKDVDGLRWAIVFDVESGAVTGNVDSPDGGTPQFVSCLKLDQNDEDVVFQCAGAGGCGCAPCPETDWRPLTDVTLPRSFFEERRCASGGSASVPLAETLRPEDVEGIERFGNTVAVAGDHAAVSAILDDEPSSVVYAFRRKGGTWEHEDTLAIPGVELFGAHIAIGDGVLAASSIFATHLFEREPGGWRVIGRFELPTIGEAELEVTDLALSDDGSTLVVGGNDNDVHAAFVYERTGGEWRETATLHPPSPAQDLGFAGSVAVDGATIVIGMSRSGGSVTGGAAFVYARQGGAWVQIAKLESSDGRLVDGFGSAVAVSDGVVLVGAAPGHQRRHRIHEGAAYVFEPTAAGYAQVAKLTTCGRDVTRFGELVEISGDLAVVGGHDYLEGGGAGDLYVFERTPAGWQEKGRLEIADAATYRDGRLLDVGGTTLLSGVPSQKRAYAFDLATDPLLPPDACPPPPEPRPLVWPLDGWRVDAPADHDMSAVQLERAREYAFHERNYTQGVVIVRHGAIVAEWYAPDRGPDSFAASWSMAKSFSGALVGIAISEGLIESVDVSLAEFYPEWAGTEKAAITLRDVLEMSSGLDWTEDYSTTQAVLSDIAHLASVATDHLSYVVDQPVKYPPGTYFNYSSGDTMLLSGVLEAATGRTAAEYAHEKLFGPLGMSPVEWWSDVPGHTLTYCCIDTPTREFAKFGLLYAREGRWGDQQIVSEEWVRDSTRPGENTGYGYQWWLDNRYYGPFRDDVFMARGFDGQYLYVFPSLDLVIARNSRYVKDPGPPIADPNLFARYPSANLVPGRGTIPPSNWNHEEFIALVLGSFYE